MPSSSTLSLSRSTKVLYGAGDLGFSLTDSILGILFAIFLVDVVGLSPFQAAAAIFAGRVWDFVNDPLIGFITDRTRTRWGRRRPFLLFGAIPFGLAFAMLWWQPPISSDLGLMAYYALAYLCYDAAATFVYMPYFALTPELTPDYDERTTLTSYRMAFSIVGGLIAFTVPLTIIGAMRPENAGRVFMMGIIFGAVAAFPLFLTFLGTRERVAYQARPRPAFLNSIRAALRNQPFLFAVGIFLFTWAALEIVQGMLLFFIKYHLDLEPLSDLIAGTVFVTALVTLPFWDWLSRRWDKRKAYIAGMVFLSVVMVGLVIATSDWGLAIILALAAFAGVGVAAVHVLPWSMVPDAVEWDEYHTGERHEGMFYSLVTLLRKIAAAVALPLVLVVLGWTGYVANAEQQTPSAVLAIRLMTGLVPAVCLSIGIVFALVYPLNRERHAQLRAELAARRAAESLADS